VASVERNLTDRPPGPDRPHMVVLGHVAGVYGIQGWVRIHSETDPIGNILRYRPWYLGPEGQVFEPVEGRRHGKGLVARLAGCSDRDLAATLVGKEIAVPRDRLPPPKADEFYWFDLEGLSVVTTTGTDLGKVDHLFATGANDVLCVRGERERLIPFVWDDVVKDVDFAAGRVLVDWDPDF